MSYSGQARSQEDAAGAPEEEEEADEGVVEEEFGEEAVMTTEQEFDFKEFVSRWPFAFPDCSMQIYWKLKSKPFRKHC